VSVDPAVIQSAFARIARDVALRDRFERDPEATLAELGLDERDRAGMLGCSPTRLLAYHEMVHSRLTRTIRTFLGGAAERLGHERLRAEVDAWIAGPGPTTPYLRDIPAEFLAWARPRWEADASLPPWLGEFAAHRILLREVRNDPRVVGEPTNLKLELERPVVCNGTARVVRYRWAVHQLPRTLRTDDGAPLEPAEQPTTLVAFRNLDEQPTTLEIKPRSARMLELLLAGETLRAALFGAVEAMGETLDDEILAVTAVTLADLVDRHVLLGG
jgi:uncharacterized protein